VELPIAGLPWSDPQRTREVPETALPPRQRSFDDLGTPLHEVTFCVVDLETTGASHQDRITEVGAVKMRAGERLGTFQTLVNPGAPIPAEITVLTGITETMVCRSPSIEEVLPTFLEFCGGAVLVGHNVRFDTGFLDRALLATERDRLGLRVIDTLALARRLLVDEVPNCRLDTLAARLRLPHRPSHRALDDALATADLLHALLERAGSLGVLGLDDLVTLPTIAGHPQAPKLKLTSSLPRATGVYVFRDRGGRILYVGKATDLRARVRSYFSSDRRRKVAPLLRETERIDHHVCPGPLEADVVELRLIREHRPRYNRQATNSARYVYLKLTLNERFPRLSVVRSTPADGGLYLGPLPSQRAATVVVEAIQQAVPIRRCTARSLTPAAGATTTMPCTPAQLGVAACPCSGLTAPSDYADIVDVLRRGLSGEPDLLLEPLRLRMQRLAGQERFEEAVDVRDRAAALVRVLDRQQRLDSLRRSGTVVLATRDGGGCELDRGRLVRTWASDGPGAGQLPLSLGPAATPPADDDRAPVSREAVDEMLCVSRWMERKAPALSLRTVTGWLASPVRRLPSFDPPQRRLLRREG
jgi:DNA polymerase III subunit epsilon